MLGSPVVSRNEGFSTLERDEMRLFLEKVLVVCACEYFVANPNWYLSNWSRCQSNRITRKKLLKLGPSHCFTFFLSSLVTSAGRGTNGYFRCEFSTKRARYRQGYVPRRTRFKLDRPIPTGV